MVKTSKNQAEDAPLLTPPKKGEELFGGEGKFLTVTKDVHPLQLMDEVYARLGDRTKYEVVCVLEDDDNPVSEENPLVLHVMGNSVDLRTVRGVVESHEKDEHYGRTEEEKHLEELKERLRSGEDLPASELNALLRSML